MIEYLEAVQVLPENSTEEPDAIRIELTGYSTEEQSRIVDAVKALMEDVAPYVVWKHLCRHDEGLPCTVVSPEPASSSMLPEPV